MAKLTGGPGWSLSDDTPPPAVKKENPNSPKPVIRLERRTGKYVTVVSGLHTYGSEKLNAMAKEWKTHCGAGGTIKNGVMLFRGVSIENDVFIGPGVTFTNDKYPRSPRMPEVAGRYKCDANWLAPTVVRRGATIGARAVILPGRTIGAYAVVGAAAVVTRDVADHRLVLGNPARAVGWMCVCGFPLREPWTCGQCRRRFEMRNDQLALMD